MGPWIGQDLHWDGGRGAGLGPGGLKEPLAQPTLRPAPLPSSSGVGSLRMLQGPLPGTPAEGPAFSLDARLWHLVGSARAEALAKALVPARGNHYEVTLLPGFPAN